MPSSIRQCLIVTWAGVEPQRLEDPAGTRSCDRSPHTPSSQRETSTFPSLLFLEGIERLAGLCRHCRIGCGGS